MRQLLGCQRDNCIRAHSTAAGTTLQKKLVKRPATFCILQPNLSRAYAQFFRSSRETDFGCTEYSNYYSMRITSFPQDFSLIHQARMPKTFWPSKPLLPQPVSHQSTQNRRAKISGSPVLVPRTFCLIFYTAHWSHVQNRAQLFVRGRYRRCRRLPVTPHAFNDSGGCILSNS